MRSALLCLLIACGGPHKTIQPSTVGNESSMAAASGPAAGSSSTAATPTGSSESMGSPNSAAGDKLALTAAEPAKGDANGGTYVMLRGTRFIKDGPRMMKIYFGDVPGNVIRFQSDSEVIVQAPAGTAGDTVDIRAVFDPGGDVVLPKAFTFVDKS
jgi:hypothetical protein